MIGQEDEDDSDWNDLVSEGAAKLRPQSRLFFDAHVEELVGGLFQTRLDPVLHALNAINDTIASTSTLQPSRSLAESVPSDADDEDDTHSSTPPRSPRDKRMEKIKSALADVLMSQPRDSENSISEQSLKDIKDAVLASNNSHEFAEIKAQIMKLMDASSRNEHLQASVDNISRSVAQSYELDELRTSVLAALQKVQIATRNPDHLESARRAARQDVDSVNETVRDAVDQIVTTLGDRIDDAKFALQDISAGGVQRTDIAELKSIVTSSLIGNARKEDLLPLHNVLAEAFEKSAKSEELVELNRVMIDIMNSMRTLDDRPTYQEVLKLKQENERFNAILHEVLRVTQISSAGGEETLDAVKSGNNVITSRVGEVYNAVREVSKLVQTNSNKSAMRRALAEEQMKEDTGAIRNSIAESRAVIQDHLKDMSKSLPSLEDFRFVAESLEETQLNVKEFKSAMVEATTGIPRMEDITRGVEGVLGVTELREGDRKSVV